MTMIIAKRYFSVFSRKFISAEAPPIGGAVGSGPGGGNCDGPGPDIPYWVWYCCTTARRGMVPMMTSKGTWRSSAGPDGSTINWRKFNSIIVFYIIVLSHYCSLFLFHDVQLFCKLQSRTNIENDVNPMNMKKIIFWCSTCTYIQYFFSLFYLYLYIFQTT